MKITYFIICFTIITSVLLAGCQTVELTPENQTGVHLQAKFEIPFSLQDAVGGRVAMNYLVYLPDGYYLDPNQSFPLILFLHGSGGEVNDSKYVMSYGLPSVLYKGEGPDEFPFIVISPQALGGFTWWTDGMPAVLDALLEEVSELYTVDIDRIYLTGLSMGGYGSWHMSSTYPDRFAAVISIAGSGFGNVLPNRETLCAVAETPLWAIHGAEDLISDPAGSKFYVASLQGDCGGTEEVRWTLYEDAGHFEAYERAYRDPALYDWLLSHARNQ